MSVDVSTIMIVVSSHILPPSLSQGSICHVGPLSLQVCVVDVTFENCDGSSRTQTVRSSDTFWLSRGTLSVVNDGYARTRSLGPINQKFDFNVSIAHIAPGGLFFQEKQTIVR